MARVNDAAHETNCVTRKPIECATICHVSTMAMAPKTCSSFAGPVQEELTELYFKIV